MRRRGHDQRAAGAAIRPESDPVLHLPRRLLPEGLASVTQRGTPSRIIVALGFLIALLAGLIPLQQIVELVNVGTLFAFVIVNVGVLVLRRTRPDMPRGYRVPFSPVFPAAGDRLRGLSNGRSSPGHLDPFRGVDGGCGADLHLVRLLELSDPHGAWRARSVRHFHIAHDERRKPD